jgi:hypothetical protein
MQVSQITHCAVEKILHGIAFQGFVAFRVIEPRAALRSALG